jgi:LCP family protein required for cell wall assembly
VKNNQKTILSVLFIFACITLLVSFYYVGEAYFVWSQKPLGPLLKSATPAQAKLPATWTPQPSKVPPATVTLAPILSFETNTPISSILPACYNLPPMTILAVGVDQHSSDDPYGHADAIRLVRVDYVARRVSVLEFPRDLWVKIPEIEDDIQQNHDKLNMAYFYGNPDLQYWNFPSQGPGLLARTLELNLGARADHYVAVNMNVFADLVNALGGIDITLPKAVDGRTASDRSVRLFFPAGDQHLTGEQALTLGRIRNVSVFARAEHQDLVMCAVRKKMEDPNVLAKMPKIISSFQQHIQTDLTPAQISQLACLGVSAPRSNILFASFPRELFKASHPESRPNVFIWDTDFEKLSGYVEQFEKGTWPRPSLFAGSDSDADSCE